MPKESFHFATMLGSLRQGSQHAVLQRSLRSLAPADVTISHLGSIGEFPHYNADIQATGFPGPAVAMAEAITLADGVIIITPEYNYSIPGVLKNAIDWLSRMTPQPFAKKPVAIMTGSPGAIGGARAQYQLRQSLVFLDAYVVNKPEIMVSQIGQKITGTPPELTDLATRKLIGDQIQALVELTRTVG